MSTSTNFSGNPQSQITPKVVDSTKEPSEPEIAQIQEKCIPRTLAAALIGVAPAAIASWADLGQLRVDAHGQVPIAEVRRKTIEVYEKKKVKTAKAGEGAGGDAGTSESAFEAKVRLEGAKANLAELDFEQRLAACVSAEAVRLRWLDVCASVKVRLMALPDRLAEPLAATNDRHKVRSMLTVAIHQSLTSLAKPFKMQGDDEELTDGGTEER